MVEVSGIYLYLDCEVLIFKDTPFPVKISAPLQRHGMHLSRLGGIALLESEPRVTLEMSCLSMKIFDIEHMGSGTSSRAE